MIGAVDAATVRRLAKSIAEARREGRVLKPLTNTRLISYEDALKIQEELLDMRIRQGERLVGWLFDETGEVAPITDRMILESAPIGLVEGRKVAGLAISRTGTREVTLVIDRVIKGGLREDFVAHGCGLVGVLLGEASVEITNADGIREEVTACLQRRNRVLADSDLILLAIR